MNKLHIMINELDDLIYLRITMIHFLRKLKLRKIN